jgi:hypothetical protein
VSDLEFYNVGLQGRGVKGRLLAPARRAVRQLLLPVFQREVEILADLCRRLDEGVINGAALRAELHATAERLTDESGKAGRLNVKLDQLNVKLDELNTKFEGLLRHFEALRERQDGLSDDVAAVVALNWDHTALARRLAQLEDRLIGLAGPESPPMAGEGDSRASISFPGLERYDPAGRLPHDRDDGLHETGPHAQAG